MAELPGPGSSFGQHPRAHKGEAGGDVAGDATYKSVARLIFHIQ